MNGKNILVNMDGKVGKHGFFQTFQVEAKDPETAELNVVKEIQSDEDFVSIILNKENDPSRVFLDEIYEIEEFNKDIPKASGRIWYKEKKWWQVWK